MNFKQKLIRTSACVIALAGCASNPQVDTASNATSETAITDALKKQVQTIVVIYAENQSFDKLYSNFPGANGLTKSTVIAPQLDFNNQPFQTLPPSWGGVTATGQQPAVSEAQSAKLANTPFFIESAYGVPLTTATITKDLGHQFFENQMQINGGMNDKFVAYNDTGGLAMGLFDGRDMQLYKLAQQYVLADNYFSGTFGASYINHHYLVCACLTEYPDADKTAAKSLIAAIERDRDGNFTHNLTLADNAPTSAMQGAVKFKLSGALSPKNYFGDNTFYALRTMQPAYQPSINAPAANDTSRFYADPAKPTTLPPQTQTTIGDLLSQQKITWAWYSTAWNASLAIGRGNHQFPRAAPGEAPNFQFHHQPFNYFQNFDPLTHADNRNAHLKDYDDLVIDAAKGNLPAVVFYKPQGNLAQHPGYSSIAAGDAHIADLVNKLQAGPQWKNMLIIITYDDYGGGWDHVRPPVADLIGPGTRLPAILISPLAKKNFVDHTQYDTGSILRLITRQFSLPILPGLAQRDAALKAHGEKPMGDFVNALALGDGR